MKDILIDTFTVPAKAKIPHAASATGIKYYSVDSLGNKAEVTATIQTPMGKTPVGGWPVIAWAHGTIGISDPCAYSINGPAEPERDWDYLNTWIDQGYAVVASDYQGIGTPGKHAYLNGKMEAHNIVDAVKAAREYSQEISTNWVVAGQSQGGGAAVKTARYATEFGGNELNYLGAVGTGVPAYIEILLPAVITPNDNTVTTPKTVSYALYLISGLNTAYPQAGFLDLLTNEGKKWLAKAEAEPLFELAGNIEKSGITVGKILAKGLNTIPNINDILTEHVGLETSGYDKPIFVGQGLLDTDIFTAGTLYFILNMEKNQQPIESHVYPYDNHDSTVNNSLKDSLPFVRKLFTEVN